MKLNIKDTIINFDKNISIIYYKDFIEFNEFLSDIKTYLNKGNYHFLDSEFQIDDILWIDMNIDLKKDFSLGKTSNLRKEIIKITSNYFEANNLDINDIFDNDIFEKISRNITDQISSDQFKILIDNKNNLSSDIVDNIFEPIIVNENNEEIYIDKFNQWNLSEIYIEMLLNKEEIKNKLILINDYDQYLINDKKIFDQIKKLKDNNLLILTSRNISFLNEFKYLNSLSVFINSKLSKLIFNKKIFEKQFLLKDFDKEVLEFDTYEINSSYLIEDIDIMKMKNNISYAIKSIFNELFYKNEIDVSYLNEFTYLSLLFILEDNKNIFKSKLIYKNKLSDISKYILAKYYEN